ncbi:MAG: Gfo/Idh/MocA family oxidoreductase [Mycobacteriales bacterium]
MTSEFRTLPSQPLRAVLVGAGSMGRTWLAAVAESPDVALAGVVDVDVEAAHAALDAAGLSGVMVGDDLGEVAEQCTANVVLDITTPDAHVDVTLEALALGLPVLGEKPLAPTVEAALVLVAASRAAGELFMVSQSRRYNRHLREFRRSLLELGSIGIATCEFFKAPRFGGFRDQMAHPLLLDMGIHQFDAARYLLDESPVAVYCEEYNPAWSWYAGDAAATAIFEMQSGCRFIFSGSWCSPGQETSWDSAWRISGERGTALWDGNGKPTGSHAGAESSVESEPESIAGALAEFVHALRTGVEPMGIACDNVQSLAMVEAAIASAATGQRMVIADLLEEAYTAACMSDHRLGDDELRASGSAAALLAQTQVEQVAPPRPGILASKP